MLIYSMSICIRYQFAEKFKLRCCFKLLVHLINVRRGIATLFPPNHARRRRPIGVREARPSWR